MTILQDAMFQVPHLPLQVTQVNKETIKAFSHSKKVGGYLLGRTLGVGSFAKVKEGLHISTGEKAAVKIIDKKRAKNDSYVRKNLRREGKLLQAVRHPNIVALLEILETDNSYYLVTELCKGGDLMDYISARKRLQEKEVLRFIRQIVSAIDYLHNVGIIHRDLKIENLLLDGNHDIKLIDFGLSNFIKVSDASDRTKEGELCSTQCGSPAYAAPELLNHEQYGLQVDSWSIGVNMFAMLTGGLPFTVEPFNIKALYVKMRDGQMNPVPEGLTKECRDLLRRFLTPDPVKRVTIEQALVHPWITHGNSQPVVRVPCPNKLKTNDLNTDILSHMSDNLGFRMGEIIKFVTCNTPSAACATYHLYLTRLKRYQTEVEDTSRKSFTTGKRSGILDNKRFSKHSLNEVANVRTKNKINDNKDGCSNEIKTSNRHQDNVDDSDDNNDNNNNEQDPLPSPMSSLDPEPKSREGTGCPPSPHGVTTPATCVGDHTDALSIESPRSDLSDTSDRKENKNPLARTDSTHIKESPHLNGNQSPHPTFRVNRSLSIRPHQEMKKPSAPVPASMTQRPRLYKRRGESNPSATTPKEKFTGDVRETIQVLDVQRSPREVAGVIGSVSRSEHTHNDLALSWIVSTPHVTRDIPGDQSSRRGSGVGLVHIAIGGVASGGARVNGTATSRGLGGASSEGVPKPKRLRDTAKSPANFLRRCADARRQSLSGQVDSDRTDNVEARILGSVDGNAKPSSRSYLQNKRVSVLTRRAAVLKTVEVKPAPGSNAGNDTARERLQEINTQGRNSSMAARPTPQAYRIIPRPFVPFRSAHERPSGLSSSFSHQMGPPQKAKTAETLTIRHENSGTLSSRVSGTPIEAGEAPPPGPPRPVVVRKRLAKRHRLGEIPSLQPSLIQDIEQTVTANSFVSADAMAANAHSRKTSYMNESLP